EIVVAIARQALLVREAGECDLSEDTSRSVAEGSGDGAIGTDIETLQRAAARAVLLDGGRTVGGSQLSDDWSRTIEQIPVKSLVAGSVGEGRYGNSRDIYRRRVRFPGAHGVRDQIPVAVEGQGATDQRCGRNTFHLVEVGGRNGNRIAPRVGAGVGVRESELVGRAERIVDGGLGGIS